MIHHIFLRVTAHSTEDRSRVRKALDFFLLNSINRGADVSTDDIVDVLDADGHYGNPMTIFSAKISRKKECLAFAKFVRSNITSDDLELLRSEMPSRLDDDQVFHLRLDKQAAYEGEVRLTSSSDAITAKVKIETYPKDWVKAGMIVEELFG